MECIGQLERQRQVCLLKSQHVTLSSPAQVSFDTTFALATVYSA